MDNNKVRKSTNASSNKDGNLRHDILEEIGQYHYDDSGSSIKRFVKSDPSKILTKPKSIVKSHQKKFFTSSQPAIALPPSIKEKPITPRSSRHFSWKIWLAIGLGILMALLMIFLWSVYRLRLDKKISNLVNQLSLPLAYVDGSILSLKEFNSEVVTLQNYYQRIAAENSSSEEISLAEIENIVLERMIKQQIVSNFAKRNKITVTAEEVAAELLSISIDFSGEENLKEFISFNYNWTIADFKDKIILPYLQRKKVTEWFVNNESAQITVKARAQNIKDDIINGVISFAEAAHKYSDDLASAAQGGVLGPFTRGTMVPEFEAVVESLAIDQISEPVKTSFGWHIIRRDSLPQDTNLATVDLSASHILIRDFDFDKWLESERKKTKTLIFLKIDNFKL